MCALTALDVAPHSLTWRRRLLYRFVGELKATRIRAGKLVPVRVRPAIRRLLDLTDRLMIKRYRSRTGEARPIPPRSLRVSIGGASIEDFFSSGEKQATQVTRAMAAAGRPITQSTRVLDFGCGCGRTLCALAESGPELFACDVNGPAVRWVQENLKGVRAWVSDFMPPLPDFGQPVSAAYSISVFTHLAWPLQLIWLTELARVLEPGAPLIASTHGEAAIRSPWWGIACPERAPRIRSQAGRLDDEGLLFFEDPRVAEGDTKMSGITGSWGVTFQSPGHIRQHWSEHFDVVEVQEGALEGFHDLVVLRRRE